MSTWDVHTPAGDLVTDLKGLAAALHTTPERAAKQLLDDVDLAAAAPTTLLAEVKAAPKPGAQAPISGGSFVEFPGGKGRVDLIVSKGKVPGVEDDVEGTVKAPAARVVVWEGGKPTETKRGLSTHTLRRIMPLDRPERKDTASALVAIVAEHDLRCVEQGLEPFRRVTGEAVKAVYDRGIEDWPGADKTSLNRPAWALGRVEHFVKVAAGEVATKDAAGHDLDLLHHEHPLAALAPEDTVIMTREERDNLVKSLFEPDEGGDG